MTDATANKYTIEATSANYETTEAVTVSTRASSPTTPPTTSPTSLTTILGPTTLYTSTPNAAISTSSTVQASTTTPHAGSTTLSPSIWKDVSLGLIGGVVVLILICLILAIVLCRLRRRLKKASDTLYPNGSEHTYTPLKRTGKNAPVVELKHITTLGDEEEIDSPTFSAPPPPPTFPPPRSVSQSSVDKPPELPTRLPRQAVKKITEKGTKQNQKRTKSVDKEKLVKSAVRDEADGIENKAFSEAEKQTSVNIPEHEVHVNIGEDDDPYEKYDHSLYRKVKKAGTPTAERAKDGVIETATAYEVPVESDNKKSDIEKEDFIKRQSSSSGLPEFVFNNNETNLNKVFRADAPLQPDQDDIYDNEDDVEIRDTGLPSAVETPNLDDLQYYEDLEPGDDKAKCIKGDNASDGVSDAIPTSDSADKIDQVMCGTSKDSVNLVDQVLGDTSRDPEDLVDQVHSRTSKDTTSESPPDLTLYDSGEIGSKIEDDEDTTISLYEDYESEYYLTKSKHDLKKESDLPKEEIETSPEHDTLIDEPNLQVEKDEQLKEFDQSESEILTENQNAEFDLPKVPPRRDLLSKLSSSPDSVKDPLEGFPIENDQNEPNSTANGDAKDLEEKPVKQIGDIGSMPIQHSYFLDMEDNSQELNEQHQKRISVLKMVDSEMPLKQLLGLYGKRDNSLDKSSNDSTAGEDSEVGGLTLRMNDSDNEHLDKHAPESNGVIANGGVVESMDEFHDDDDNLYDVPPAIQTQ